MNYNEKMLEIGKEVKGYVEGNHYHLFLVENTVIGVHYGILENDKTVHRIPDNVNRVKLIQEVFIPFLGQYDPKINRNFIPDYICMEEIDKNTLNKSNLTPDERKIIDRDDNKCFVLKPVIIKDNIYEAV
jgi:hypothetical protein